MQKRKFIKRRNSKKLFKRTVDKTHMFNIKPRPMRGGIRM